MANLSNPQAIAQKQINAATAAATAYTAGVNAVTTAPGQLAAAQGTKWLNAVQNSLQRWQQKVSAVSLQSWQQLATSKGAPRLGPGVQAASAKINAFWSNFAPKLAAIQNNVRSMDSSSFDSRIARAVQMMTQLHQLKGSLT